MVRIIAFSDWLLLLAGVAGGFRTPLLVPKSMNAQVPCVKWCSTVGLSICRRPIHGFHQLHLQMQDLQMWSACCVQLSFLSVFLYLGSHTVVQSLSSVRLFATPWTAARQASLSLTVSWSLLKLLSIESVMPFLVWIHHSLFID